MAIAALENLLLRRWCPFEVTIVLLGGKLLALKKKSGGARPISYTWRRLALKRACCYAISYLDNKLLPVQLGVKTFGSYV